MECDNVKLCTGPPGAENRQGVSQFSHLSKGTLD